LISYLPLSLSLNCLSYLWKECIQLWKLN
jgi:hypothetical protein